VLQAIKILWTRKGGGHRCKRHRKKRKKSEKSTKRGANIDSLEIACLPGEADAKGKKRSEENRRTGLNLLDSPEKIEKQDSEKKNETENEKGGGDGTPGGDFPNIREIMGLGEGSKGTKKKKQSSKRMIASRIVGKTAEGDVKYSG